MKQRAEKFTVSLRKNKKTEEIKQRRENMQQQIRNVAINGSPPINPNGVKKVSLCQFVANITPEVVEKMTVMERY